MKNGPENNELRIVSTIAITMCATSVARAQSKDDAVKSDADTPCQLLRCMMRVIGDISRKMVMAMTKRVVALTPRPPISLVPSDRGLERRA